MPVRCSLLLTMRSNPNIAQRRQLKSGEFLHLKDQIVVNQNEKKLKIPKISIKSFLTTLDAGSKYGLRLNVANLKIIESPETLVLEMKDLTLDEIEDLLIQSLGKKMTAV